MGKFKPGFLKGTLNIRLGNKTLSLSKRVTAAVLAVIIAAGAGTCYFTKRGKNDSGELITAVVTRGSISSVVEGTGVIEAINQYEITSLAKGDVTADYFEEGDYVEKGQLLYEIDSSSVTRSIEKAQSSLEKAQMTHEQAVEDAANLNVKSDVTGVITEINVKKGDQVSSGMTVAKVVDKDNLILSIPFNSEDAANLYIGQTASVSLENSFTAVSGTISRIGTGSTVNSYGVSVTSVEISVKNPGSIVPGDKATAIAGNYACNDDGEFEYKNESSITAKTSGKVISVPYKAGDKISSGATIVSLESTSISSNVKSSRLSVNEAELSLRDSQDSLDDYKITAPISGKVIEKNVKAGEKLDQNSTSTMAIISDLSTLVFEMSIDELDINKIQTGQEVQITADAFDDKTFTGTVTNVSIVGTSTQGVTSYPVKVTIDNGEESGLIPGMNVTGDIVVESVSDVLRVPVSAVRRGNYVVVKDGETAAQGDNEGETRIKGEPNDAFPNAGEMPDGVPDGESTPAPDGTHGAKDGGRNHSGGSRSDASAMINSFIPTAMAAEQTPSDMTDDEKAAARLENIKKQLDVPQGYTIVKVETGLSDDTFIEIKSRLSEGQTVLLPDSTESETNSGNNAQMNGGMPGGGMPGGGMPGGGMPGGGGAPGGGGGGMPRG